MRLDQVVNKGTVYLKVEDVIYLELFTIVKCEVIVVPAKCQRTQQQQRPPDVRTILHVPHFAPLPAPADNLINNYYCSSVNKNNTSVNAIRKA